MFQDIKNYIATTDKFTLLFAIASAWPIIGFLPSLPSIVSYVIPIIYAIYCLTKMRGMDGLFLALLFYIPLELILARPSSVFHPWQRYVLFAVLLMNVSPLLQGDILRDQREQLFQLMMWVCVFIGVGSFFARFLGINFMKAGNMVFYNQAGLFGGLTKHSMLLGPIAGIAVCYLASIAMSKRRFIDWLWVVLALMAVLFSASRSSLMAALVGLIITMYCQSGSTSNFLRVAIIAIIIAASTFSLWDSALSGVIEKNGSTSALSFDSREELWDNRIEEFKSSPVFGVGFCSSTMASSSSVDLESGRLESGSSWLIILSMLGLIGAILVVPILFRSFKVAYRQKSDHGAVICGILALFFVHMFTEGYIFAGGSFLAFMLWLTVGVAMDCQYIEE